VIFAILLIALRCSASAGDASADSTALHQDVEQDGETCLSALQVNKSKAEQSQWADIQRHVAPEEQNQQASSEQEMQRHVSQEEEVGSDASSLGIICGRASPHQVQRACPAGQACQCFAGQNRLRCCPAGQPIICGTASPFQKTGRCPVGLTCGCFAGGNRLSCC
jgi:hypothetical protein